MADDVQHNTELAELAGGFIHEIKNHLSTFGLHLALLAEDFEQPQTPRNAKRSTASSNFRANAAGSPKSPTISCASPVCVSWIAGPPP